MNTEPKIIFEDEDIVIFNKPAGLLVHNPPGKKDPSLIDFIKRHNKGVENLKWPDSSRPGIVHRLDKYTSGLIVVAKTPEVLIKLQDQFKNRAVKKEYEALVFGDTKPGQGSIVAEIARHATKDKQTVIPEEADDELTNKLTKGKIRPAHTDYETIKHFEYKKQPLTLILAKPQTGRMHQIRIHLKHLGFPIIGDQMYFFKPSRRLAKELGINRQFLHATRLQFRHPKTGGWLDFHSSLSADLQYVISQLKIKGSS